MTYQHLLVDAVVVVATRRQVSLLLNAAHARLPARSLPLEVVLLRVLHGLELRLSGVDLHVVGHVCELLSEALEKWT